METGCAGISVLAMTLVACAAVPLSVWVDRFRSSTTGAR